MQPILLHQNLTSAGIQRPNDFTLRLWYAPDGSRAVCRSYVLRLWSMQLLLAVGVFGILAAILWHNPLVWLPASGHSVWSSPIAGAAIGGVLALFTLSLPTNSFISVAVLAASLIAGASWNVSLILGACTISTIAGFLGRSANGWIWPLSLIQAYIAWKILRFFGISPETLDYRNLWQLTAFIATPGMHVVSKRIQDNPEKFTDISPRGNGIGGLCLMLTIMVSLISLLDLNIMAYCAVPALVVFRFPIWFVESIIQVAIFVKQQKTDRITLRFSPVFYDQICYFPIPLLGSHIHLTAKSNPEEAKCALEQSSRCSGVSAGSILRTLEFNELISIAAERRFSVLVNLKGFWMNYSPLISEKYKVQAAWRTLREAAGHLLAAQQTTVPTNRLSLLTRADEALLATGTQEPQLMDVLCEWVKVAAVMHYEATLAAEVTLSNPFRAGQPLAPDRGAEVFRGREEVIRHLEALLADGEQSYSVALIGPRRSGKTSLLKMLSQRLAETVTVFFDLQDNPIDTPQGFFSALARQAHEQALQTHHLQLPTLGQGPPFEAASEWLQALDSLPGQHRILLCIDEFECLERVFPGERRELEKLMGLFRATIQHRRKVRLLVSGASPFDEIERMWSHYFINVREVALDLLDRTTSCELLCRPRSDFPADVIPHSVAEEIFERTGGQPFLLQVFGAELIALLNRDARPQACIADIEHAEEKILTAWPYFRDTYCTAPTECQEVLRALAHGVPATLSISARRWLKRRCLVTAEDKLRIPILGHWIRLEIG